MQTLNDIWTKRALLMKNKTWNGDDPKAGFDFTDGIKPHLQFNSDNWNDLMITDLRHVLDSLLYGDVSDKLNTAKATVTMLDGPYYLHSLSVTNKDDETDIMIIASRFNDQPQFTIYLPNNGVFSVSWYKNRGRIDSIIDTEYGHPANLEDVTDILVALCLEEPYEDSDDDDLD